MNAASKFDRPASVTWSTAGPGGRPMPPNKREFATLREAIRYVRGMGHGARVRAVVRSGRKSYDAAAVEELERELRER